jgi:hypothetical protein
MENVDAFFPTFQPLSVLPSNKEIHSPAFFGADAVHIKRKQASVNEEIIIFIKHFLRWNEVMYFGDRSNMT